MNTRAEDIAWRREELRRLTSKITTLQLQRPIQLVDGELVYTSEGDWRSDQGLLRTIGTVRNQCLRLRGANYYKEV